MSARHAAVFVTFLAMAACASPTSPYESVGTPILSVRCGGDGSTQMECSAATTCEGLTCNGLARNVTAEATWTVVGSSVRHVGGGRFAADANGAATVSASLPREGLESRLVAVEVFPGRQPQEVYRLFGRVGHGEMSTGPFPVPVIDQALDGVPVEIVTGLAAGRQAVTGRPAEPRPGLPSSLSQPGEFEIMGVPDGDLTLLVRPPGQQVVFVHLRHPHFLPAILIPR